MDKQIPFAEGTFMNKTRIVSGFFKLVLLLCVVAGIGDAIAGYYVYTSGVYSPPAPGANQYTIDFSTRTLASEQTAGRLTYSSAAGAAQFLTSGGSISYTGSVSASGFSGNAMDISSGTTGNPSTVTVNFANPTPYVGLMWRAQFNSENTEILTLTLSDGSTKVLKNCTSSSNSQCIGMYVDDPNWLTSLLNFLFGWLFGDAITWYPIYVQYTPDNGVKVNSMQFKLYNCGGCGLLSTNTSQDWYVDNISYVDGAVVPHHLELTTVSSSVSANAATTFRIKACGDAACSTPYITGVSGTIGVSGVSATYTAAWSIPAGPTNYVDVTVTPTTAGTATMSVPTYTPTPSNTPKVFCGIGVAAASGNSCNMTVTVPLHHVNIAASDGLTCTPRTYTLTACSDAACASPYTAGLSGTLSVTGSGMTVNYPSGAAFSIPNGSSSTTVSVHATTVGSLTAATLSGLSATPTGSPSVYCGMNGSTPASGGSCTINLANSGLLFNVPNHLSDASQTVTVSAVQSSNNATACTPAFASVSKNVTFKCSYSNPTTGTLPVRVGGTALNASNSTAAACDGTGGTVSLSFNVSGVATTTVQYADVGQMSLTATYAGSGTDAGLSMTGSDSFIASPASFAFSSITASPVAGSNFAATLTAKNSSGNAVPNFGKETAVTTDYVRISWAKAKPTGTASVAGTFTGTGTSTSPTLSSSSFSNGAVTLSNLNWTEVGLGDLSAWLVSGSYLGSGTTVTGTTGAAGAVGPFVPHHFDTVITQGCSSFSYSGQPFTVQITARNAGNTTTYNYDGSANTSPNYAKAVTLSATGAGAGSGSLTAGTSVALTSFGAGVASLTTPTFAFTNKLTTPTSITIHAQETAGSVTSSAGSPVVEGSVPLRSGRLKISNAFGSEKSVLSVPVQAQYWNGKAWVLNASDSCTSVPAASVALSNYMDSKGAATAGWTTTPSAVTISSGNGTLSLGAPSPSSTGSVDFAFNLGATTTDQSCLASHPASTAANLSWLRAQNGSANGCAGVSTYDRDPSARATFGVYQPETKKAVYSRELY
jgi:MSHA biogenesis protein MshQ